MTEKKGREGGNPVRRGGASAGSGPAETDGQIREYHLKRLGRRCVHRGKVVDFCEDTMELPDGRVEKWDFIRHHRCGACVVPVLPDGRILMIRQYRPASDREMLELPAGARDYADDDGRLEETEVTARRELGEETGYRCGRLKFLFRVRPAPAYLSEWTDIYLAQDLERTGKTHPDEAEEIFSEPHELRELVSGILSGEIEDGKTIAGILGYAAYLERCRG